MEAISLPLEADVPGLVVWANTADLLYVNSVPLKSDLPEYGVRPASLMDLLETIFLSPATGVFEPLESTFDTFFGTLFDTLSGPD